MKHPHVCRALTNGVHYWRELYTTPVGAAVVKLITCASFANRKTFSAFASRPENAASLKRILERLFTLNLGWCSWQCREKICLFHAYASNHYKKLIDRKIFVGQPQWCRLELDSIPQITENLIFFLFCRHHRTVSSESTTEYAASTFSCSPWTKEKKLKVESHSAIKCNHVSLCSFRPRNSFIQSLTSFISGRQSRTRTIFYFI